MTTPGYGNQIQAGSTNRDWGHAGLQFWENDYAALRQILQAMNPGNVESAGAAYRSMADRISATMDLLLDQSRKMGEAWGGEDAEAALRVMNRAYQQAHEIYRVSNETSSALSSHASMQQDYRRQVTEENWYGTDIGVAGTSVGDWLKGNSHVGREIMERLQADTDRSNQNFPDSIRSSPMNLDDYRPIDGPPITQGSGQGSGGIPSTLSASGTNGPGQVGTGGSAASGVGQLPGGGSGAGAPAGHGGGSSDLAGFTPPSGGAGGIGSPGGLGASGIGGAGGLGAGVGGPVIGAGPGGVGAGGGGRGGVGAVGASGAGAGARGRGAGVAGMGAMPMGAGGGRGDDEQERERTTWLSEDREIWTEGNEITPPVIG